MKKLWTAPQDIHIEYILNNRELDTDYIAALAESMENKGFLVEYPIEVFESDNIPGWHHQKPYVCACGAHRTEAALFAGLDEVLVVIHEGNEEDWIEKMSLDNFKFDVAEDSSIGQAFTPKEKKAACIQLLLLPKYLQITNTALAEKWNTSEGSIRGWKKIVASYIYEDSPKLQEFGVSEDRVQRLKAILDSTEREDANGKPVQVRKPERKATAEEKNRFYREIRSDAGDFAWGTKLKKKFLGRHDITWEDVSAFISEKWNVADDFRCYEHLSLGQLRKLHNMILTEDAFLIARCQEIAKVRKELETTKSDLSAACKRSETKLHESFCPNQSTYSDRFKTVKEIFIRAAKVEGYTDFTFDSYKYGRENGIGFLRLAIEHHTEVSTAIEEKAAWVEAVRVTIAEEEAKTRKQFVSKWNRTKKEMLDAFEAYPRKILLETFCYAFDDQFHEKAGYLLKRIHKDASDLRSKNDSLDFDAKHFTSATEALKENKEWVKRIPEQKHSDDASSHQHQGVEYGENSEASQTVNWDRIRSSMDVIRTEFDKVEWSDAEKTKIEELTSAIQATLDQHTTLSRRTKLWVLANIAYNYMEQLDGSANSGDSPAG